MARTPLMQSLQRLAADYRLARATGLPLRAIRELRAEARRRAPGDPERPGATLTRRELLYAAGAALTTVALPRPARAADAPRIAIVGGGIAGLACALHLADEGIASTIYEATDRIGGRIFSNTSGYWDDNQVSEWMGELIDTGHRTIRRLAHRFHLALDNVRAAEPDGSEDTYHFLGEYYPRAQAEADFPPVFEAVLADEEAAPFPTTFDDFTPAGKALDNVSVFDWIETRVAGGHTTSFGRLLDAAYAVEYGADTTQQSALNLVYLLAFQPHPSTFEIFGESDERFHIRGGNQQLPQAIARHLGLDTVVRRGLRLVRIQKTPGGRYRLWFESHRSIMEVVADYVVLALPFAVLREIDTSQAGFDPLKQRAIQELGRGHNSKLQLQFITRYWNQPGPWPGVSNGTTFADTGYQASWDVTRAQAGASGILNFYSGGSVTDAMSTQQVFAQGFKPGVLEDAQRALAQVEPVFPGLAAVWNQRVTQSLPHKSPFFRASYAHYRVGQYTTFGGYERVPQDGVFFCGEHTSLSFQGFMEGGASEGIDVARRLTRIINNVSIGRSTVNRSRILAG
jgi:monoamine oxidase